MNQYTGIYRRCELLYTREALEKYGLQPLEGKMLYFLRNKRCSQEDICAYFHLDKGRIAKSLYKLETYGVICRAVNEQNRRQKLVSLTEKGYELLNEIDLIFKNWDAICFSGFSEEERRICQDFTRRIAENAMKYRQMENTDTSKEDL